MPRLTEGDRLRRRQGLGGSDIAALLGRSRWKTALQLYAEKRGLIEDEGGSEAADWGHRLEPVVAEEFAARRPGIWLQEVPAGMTHPERPWAMASPDRMVCSVEGGTVGGLEIKTRRTLGPDWGEPHTDQVPEDVLLQCQWYLYVTGWPRWWVAVLGAGQEYREYEILPNALLHERMVTLAAQFWAKVEAGEAPVPELPRDESLLGRVIPQTSDALAERDDLASLAAALREAKVRAEHYDGLVTHHEAEFKLAIGEEAGVRGYWGSATWKATKDSTRIQWEALAKHLMAQHPPETQASLLLEYSKIVPGSRRFLFRPTTTLASEEVVTV